MKKFHLLPLLFALTMFTACSDDDGGTPPPPDNVYKVSGVCEVKQNSDATITITMKQAKFASKMPAMDIFLPNIPFFADGNNIQLAASSITPEVEFHGVVGPYKEYIIENFSGRITAEGELSFQGLMHLGKIEFTGNKEGDSYKGTTTTTSPGGDAPTDVPAIGVQQYENVTSTAEKGENSVTITLNGVKFAPQAPKMNIRIPDIAHKEGNSYYSAAAIPLAQMGEDYMPVAKYTMSDIECDVTENNVYLRLTFPMGYLRYKATATEEGYIGTMSYTKITE